ncbi:hypothetical protein [Aestuariispira insulae]|uniref:hypothetical protein n=1 Tax=Aestuariispira insulae TaxID=1461337 RepID=UPI0011C05160|nr:hypothetical protein [Aestuariispira insulae]
MESSERSPPIIESSERSPPIIEFAEFPAPKDTAPPSSGIVSKFGWILPRPPTAEPIVPSLIVTSRKNDCEIIQDLFEGKILLPNIYKPIPGNYASAKTICRETAAQNIIKPGLWLINQTRL